MSGDGRNRSNGDRPDHNEVISEQGEISIENSQDYSSTQLSEELEKCKSDFLYLKAEFDNYKKHMIRERSDLVKYGSERLILSLLDVLDVLDRALEMNVSPDTIEAFVNGVRLTAEELRGVLARFGVLGTDPIGEQFDPSLHEALSSEETNQTPAGHISRVFRRAYKLHDRVIRPAQVVVAREPQSGNSDRQ